MTILVQASQHFSLKDYLIVVKQNGHDQHHKLKLNLTKTMNVLTYMNCFGK